MALATNPSTGGSGGGGSNTDETAKVSANDTTAGYLNGKLVAGTNITLTENTDGGNETLTIDAASGGLSHITESYDTTYDTIELLATNADSNNGIAITPKGNGALSADKPTASTLGGNVRGAHATDWQHSSRTSATQVASGFAATITGGERNTASGNYSVVSGFLNTASGTESTIGGGEQNTATNTNATVGGGFRNDATGDFSTIGGGATNKASAFYAGVVSGGSNTASGLASLASGFSNTASGDHSIVSGRDGSATQYGEQAHASGRFTTDGDAQRSEFVMRNSTTDATQTELYLNGSSTRLSIASTRCWKFTVDVIGYNVTDGNANGYNIQGTIKNIAGTTSLIGTNTTVEQEDDAGFACVVEADNTNDALVVKVTGAASKTVRWVAHVHIVQVF